MPALGQKRRGRDVRFQSEPAITVTVNGRKVPEADTVDASVSHNRSALFVGITQAEACLHTTILTKAEWA
jgi:hypothetical protein